MDNNKTYLHYLFLLFVAGAIFAAGYFSLRYIMSHILTQGNTPAQANTNDATRPSELFYTFNHSGVLEETDSAVKSPSAYFWLSSGGKLIIKNDMGSTIIGALPFDDPWRKSYQKSSPEETGQGLYPQNLFRLVTQSVWGDVEQELMFNLYRVHTAQTKGPDAYSGIFLMSRYQDSNNLYYAGIRMDGKAVIKKKHNGTYYTLGDTEVFTSTGSYDRVSRPNLIPTNTWFSIKSQTKTLDDGAVQIRLYLSRNLGETYTLLLEVTDRATDHQPIAKIGNVGVRTDYADVLFDNYKIREIK